MKFENAYVRVFDVTVPPRDQTLFHLHANDYVFVTLGDAQLKSQVLGGPETDLPLKDGEVRFAKGPLTHRVTNVGSRPFHNVTVEILSSPGVRGDAPSPVPVPGHTVVLENDRVRVERLVLEPGQTTGMHTHTLSGLGIAVSPGTVVMTQAGQARTVHFNPGDFEWHGPTVHSLTNAGQSRFEAVEIE
jgi:quercetin dioxygenase-like cupin family protein